MKIRQQKTMLGEPSGSTTFRIRRLQQVLDEAGFPTSPMLLVPALPFESVGANPWLGLQDL
ncbi:hypothetical protein JF66_06730 [Cryobacterium sp. MLB-32]|uniref:hypothetical protein n=1 Tax=Cryobacterium sp. MLB-32 TaxID=1529318 RepID=UPI0004E61337|nr:hypothetical protein [Cryobacterium sp. MLB-32]KFF60102.1 hypothetical protein JF66_06730 [Cryobacterium sp. MLB-32]